MAKSETNPNEKPNRTADQIDHDKAIIAELMLKGYPTRKIAQHLNQVNIPLGYTISHVTVYHHTKEILEEWRESRKEMINTIVEREVAKLDMMEFEAWQAWEQSKKGKSKTKVTGGRIVNGQIAESAPGTAERTIETTTGDPRYMMIVLTCIDKRRELLGYGAAKKVEHSGSITVGVASMDETEMNKERQRIEANFLKKAALKIAT